MARKKKTIDDEVCDGLRKLAFGDVKDSILLLFASEDEIVEKLSDFNFYNISEIKRPKGGGMEIKFYDRIKALEKLKEANLKGTNETSSFYKALEKSAKNANSVLKECIDE